ncbi:MAG: bifunctional helix-turn-helix transcriptional regulator/GNAT family N-acetyltransferase [Paracoccaceae bacterium]
MTESSNAANHAGMEQMDDIDGIRAFNRLWTREIGVIGQSYLGSGLGLAEVRLLQDLDGAEALRARDMARDLGLDEAQVSRALAALERRGWLRRVPGQDRRARLISLTGEGHARAAALKAASRQAIGGMLEEMAAEPRAALVAALAAAAAALRAGEVGLDALRPGDLGWVIARHGALYARDEGYDGSFEGLVAAILAGFAQGHDPARERGWIARRDGERLGSIFCMDEGDGIARLRLFLIEPAARGSGLAQRMIEACLAFARDAGYRRMVLWTHESHRAAGRLYARNGFALTDSSPARSFGVEVVDQTWARDL